MIKLIIFIFFNAPISFALGQHLREHPGLNDIEKLLIIESDTFYLTHGKNDEINKPSSKNLTGNKDSIFVDFILRSRYNESEIFKTVHDTSIYLFTRFADSINNISLKNNYFNIQLKTEYISHIPYIAKINIYTSVRHIRIICLANKPQYINYIFQYINKTYLHCLLEINEIGSLLK